MGRDAAGCDDQGMADNDALIAFRKSPAATAMAAQIRDLNERIRTRLGRGGVQGADGN